LETLTKEERGAALGRPMTIVEVRSEFPFYRRLSGTIKMFLLRSGLGGFFGFASGDLRLQDAILGAAVDLLFANAVETRGIATCFRHDFLFS